MTTRLPPEDLHLWKVNVRDVKPLAKIEKKTPTLPSNRLVPVIRSTQKPSRVSLTVNPFLSPSPPALGKRELRRVKIEARLDMHELTLEKGFATLERFLHHAQQKGFKTVLVITGKGSLTADNTLRRQLPRWIEIPALRQLVSSLHHPAKVQDGGSGAFYLELRRAAKVRHSNTNPRPRKKE